MSAWRGSTCRQSPTELLHLWQRGWQYGRQRKRARAWRIEPLFSRVAPDQQELDTQRLLEGLEIRRSMLLLSTPLERSPQGERVHSRHSRPVTHFSHTFTIGLSIFLSLFAWFRRSTRESEPLVISALWLGRFACADKRALRHGRGGYIIINNNL